MDKNRDRLRPARADRDPHCKERQAAGSSHTRSPIDQSNKAAAEFPNMAKPEMKKDGSHFTFNRDDAIGSRPE
jgi:hypothetical protein